MEYDNDLSWLSSDAVNEREGRCIGDCQSFPLVWIISLNCACAHEVTHNWKWTTNATFAWDSWIGGLEKSGSYRAVKSYFPTFASPWQPSPKWPPTEQVNSLRSLDTGSLELSNTTVLSPAVVPLTTLVR